ncbi:MAG: hypothetical protein A3G37_01250 [Omnitrophica WOR_2 bacterium RIFCSPLOWO2_12_FULL_46_30]|nr:MAG: hypothetical protein A3D27_02840 [Omnitrophica WOR_2 bacterium RIFCSPHIGHO2_02_FULL_46_37]OGX42146.1 MAG: hypothetical protein A3H41_01760 [Omnitrophica WOR_2 bacterium RIFCSPLOWO2_02_FULL_45_28]OGX50037.1 MAG: hypothetical protein A3G37_01250 [Omnitrophica WOR_2 bacterium RIFCSPLOWO2_12_FULL_46_30]
MEEFLNKNIKYIIAQYPEVGKILERYNIGCTTCSVGSCLLKDIIEIHNLSPEVEAELLYEIERVVFPGKEVKKRPLRQRAVRPQGEIKYSPPIKKLVDEHVLIKRFIALIEPLCALVDSSKEPDFGLILDCVDFIRNYADKYHHLKEEDVLFKRIGEDLDIIKVMLEDHTTGRNHVKQIIEGARAKDKAWVIEHLKGYKELLTQHIKKEDEILYPWIDRGLSTSDVGKLYVEFSEKDASLPDDFQKRYQDFVKQVEDTLNKRR